MSDDLIQDRLISLLLPSLGGGGDASPSSSGGGGVPPLRPVIAVSEPLAEELKTLYWLKAGQCGHIDNFIDRPEAGQGLPKDGRVRLVWCGRFSPEKNLPGLLHAWSAVARRRPNHQLVLLGNGPLLHDMQPLAEGLDVECGVNLADPLA